jgi:hypothetical protein
MKVVVMKTPSRRKQIEALLLLAVEVLEQKGLTPGLCAQARKVLKK